MSHDLVEKMSGLASRINNVESHEDGETADQLLKIGDTLADLQLAAIVKQLKSEHTDYQAAIQGLNEAIEFIGEATSKIDNVAKAIVLAGKAAKLADRAVKTAIA